jgi:hypothetical protein
MIDIHHFQTLLLTVCILGFIGGVFSCVVCESGIRWLHLFIKLFFASLVTASGVTGLLLVLLK